MRSCDCHSFLPSQNYAPSSRSLANTSIIGIYVALWIVAERHRLDQTDDSWLPSDTPVHLAVVEAIKLALSLCVYGWKYAKERSSAYNGLAQDDDLEQFLPMRPSRSPSPLSPRALSPRSWPPPRQTLLLFRSPAIPAFALALLYTCRSFLVATADGLADLYTLHIMESITALLSLVFLRLFFSRTSTSLQWHAVLLQICGLIIVRSTLLTESILQSSLVLLAFLAFFTSLTFVLNDHVYKIHENISFSAFNIILFSSGLFMQLFIHFTQQDTHPSGYLREDAWSSQDLMLPLLEALRDIASLSVIYNMNAALEGVLRTCGAAILLFRAAMSAHFFSAEQYGGYFLVVLATVTFISSHTPFSGEDVHPKWNRRRGTTATLTVVALALYALFIHGPQHAYLPTILNDATPPANVHPPSIAEILKHTACPRNPLPGAQPWPHQRDGSNASDTYHEFDDVLLIVFFSHARYDVNLDYYQEVYAPFFPNMLFIGPGNREDLGFEHSYDVLVDSYQADEDLSDPTFYKMAGRMAHHMLYTAMQAHPCYKGYLWAPFDTLLNVPRLQLFDQDKFWYHSPWGQFVLNPATNRSDLMTERASERLDPQAVERGAAPSKNFEYNRDFFVNGQSGRRNGWNATAGGRNMTGHAPPAAVSPDPYGNVTETWKGWGQDWWWGDPHVGLSVCMPAFNRTPLHMRTRLAAMTNGTTRLIGGSADTMYIPGKHRDDFLDVLGTFLATDCFLEIATPTALHLVAPRAEDILFVDHWWIWTPPLNATFVREKWEEGLEVDTFHTFHWGDKGDDGKWAANPDNINDVRSLLVESAERQGIDWEW